MKAIDEYIAFTVFRNKNHLEGVVTLEDSENDYDNYIKRIFLRRLFLYDDFNDREIEILMKRLGIFTKGCSLEEIALSRDITKERIRQIEAKALRKLHAPYKLDPFLKAITTKGDFEKAILLARKDNEEIAERLQNHVKYFDEDF